jgi:hypothetical protein
MPHHESGLLGLKTRDVKVIDRAVAFFLEKEPHHSIDRVRVDEGRGVLLAFALGYAEHLHSQPTVRIDEDRGRGSLQVVPPHRPRKRIAAAARGVDPDWVLDSPLHQERFERRRVLRFFVLEHRMQPYGFER